MRRREFILFVTGATAAWPLAARAQQPERMRRISVLMTLAADDTRAQGFVAAFMGGLQTFGWADGRNVRMEIRWGGGDPKEFRRHASELAALAPDVIFAVGAVTTGPLL